MLLIFHELLFRNAMNLNDHFRERGKRIKLKQKPKIKYIIHVLFFFIAHVNELKKQRKAKLSLI